MNRIAISFFFFVTLCASALADVSYSVRVNPAAKTLAIRMDISEAKEVETISIPAWCPGFYFLLDYEKSLFDFRATDPDGNKLVASKAGQRSFRVANPAKRAITISYRIQAADTGLGFFRTHIRGTSAFINGPSAFMYAEGHLTEPHRVKFNFPAEWDIATAMDRTDDGGYIASGYDELVDHPVQFGLFVRKKFTVDSIPFEVIWVADPKARCNIDEETERIRKGSVPAIRMMGGAPFKHYTYIVHLEVGDFAGGLEHRASTCIAVPNGSTVHLDSLATHEYFHAWNIKQIRPQILGPFDYSKEQRTGNLWFSEGVTDYYADRHAYQAGLMSESQFLETLRLQIDELQASKTRLKMTIEEVCKNTWENGGFGVDDLSYYTHGLVAGFVFDAAIRGETGGKKSLDDVLRTAMERYRIPKPGFGEDDLRTVFIEIGGPRMGTLYDRMIRSKAQFPFEELERIGLQLTVPGQVYTDLPFVVDGNGHIAKTASQTGPQEGDFLVGASVVGSSKPVQLEIDVMRNGKAMKFTILGRQYKASDYRLSRNRFATEDQKARLSEWLEVIRG